MVTSLPLLLVLAVATAQSLLQGDEQRKNSEKTTRPAPQIILKGIKSAAENEVRSNSSLIKPPRFDLKQVGSSMQLNIVKGSVGDLQFGNDPYEVPFEKQLLIEALRGALLKSQLSESKMNANAVNAMTNSEFEEEWQRYLVKAESLVKETIVEIESGANKDELAAKLRRTAKEIDKILYDDIYNVVDRFAESRKYSVNYEKGGDQLKKFSVNITTVPERARVFLMTDLVYRKQLLMNAHPSQWPWTEIVQNPYDLLGKYRYLTIWPGGKQTEGSINVANASPIKLQQ